MLSTRELFALHGLRCTRQRMEIYDSLRACRCHPTAEELHRLVSRDTGTLSLATVYNTLEALDCAGLVRRLNTPTGCARFDADTRPHAHLHDAETGEIVDIPHDLGDELLAHVPADVIARIERELGTRVTAMAIQLTGSRADHGREPANGNASAGAVERN
ncbi:MAG: Fur family transcriptional regulator [Phycisphaerales bacterium]